MPETNPKCFHLSASSIQSFKSCPQRFRLAYREGLRVAADTDSQRQGTNWHKMHEVYAHVCNEAFTREDLGLSTDECKELALDAVIAHLNEQYDKKPASKTVQEWALERQILLTCFVGYLWRWQEDPVEVLASEVPFELPIHMPKTGLPLPISECVRVGKIDHVIRWQGMVGCLERKSTSRSIASDSDYWDKAKKDTQVSMYALAFRDMLYTRDMTFAVMRHPDLPDDRAYGNTLYDVWHKPTIKPKMLTQAETGKFVETAEYYGQKFNVQCLNTLDVKLVTVNDEECEIEPGKKGFAIRETVEMYGARLLADIYERPDFYYARREIARTDQELDRFRVELFNIYQMQKTFSKTGCWFENESQCRATFACPFIPICYGPGADAVCDGKTTPNGYRRIFVDLKVNGEILED